MTKQDKGFSASRFSVFVITIMLVCIGYCLFKLLVNSNNPIDISDNKQELWMQIISRLFTSLSEDSITKTNR